MSPSTTRLVLAVAAFVTLAALPVSAQNARATGTVRDTSGKPIKGATIRAVNKEFVPSEVTSITDDKGRWAMIGLRSGTWTFIVEAPGFAKVEAPAPARVGNTSPLAFVLARDLGPIPNALVPSIAQLIAAANVLRDEGRLDQALAAYQDIRGKNPTLTHLHLVIADVHRQRAAKEREPAARRAMLDLAIASYDELLKADTANERARTELASTRAEAAALR